MKRAVMVILGLVIACAFSSCSSDHVSDHVSEPYAEERDGGEHSHQYFNAGEILEIDEKEKTFTMTVDDDNKDRLPDDTVSVSYSNVVNFLGNKEDFCVGADIVVGYLMPVEDEIKAQMIDVRR